MAYCERCERYFSSSRALWQHEQDSPRHYVCRSCGEDFIDWNSLEDHENEEHFPCRSCDVVFSTDKGIHEHNRQEHWYCDSCRRVFRNENNLNEHLKSSIHVARTVRCPGANCGRAFVSVSALVLHFESGTCSSGLTREELNRMVVRMDRNNVLTNPARLICGPDGYAPANVTKSWATERSWNGHAYECFLCHGTFHTLHALNAHLQSPRHQEKIYRCPNRASCDVEFRVLSALTQHVESGKCGVNRFKEVQNALDSLTRSIRTLTLS